MSENLTKIFCGKIPTKFVVLYIRFRGYNKNDLNLVKFNSSYKICDTRIRNDCLNAYEEFRELNIDIEDYFNVNILTASSKRRSNEFTIQRKRSFDQEKEVGYKIGTNSGTKLLTMSIKLIFKTVLLLCDKNQNYFLEEDLSVIKSLTPYEIPINCLLSLYKLPPIQSIEDLEEYSELHQFGFNIYRLMGNKAELSPNFPGKN